MGRDAYRIGTPGSIYERERHEARMRYLSSETPKRVHESFCKHSEAALVRALEQAERSGKPLPFDALKRFVYNAITIDAIFPSLGKYAPRVLAAARAEKGYSRRSPVASSRELLIRRIEKYLAENPKKDTRNDIRIHSREQR